MGEVPDDAEDMPGLNTKFIYHMHNTTHVQNLYDLGYGMNTYVNKPRKGLYNPWEAGYKVFNNIN